MLPSQKYYVAPGINFGPWQLLSQLVNAFDRVVRILGSCWKAESPFPTRNGTQTDVP